MAASELRPNLRLVPTGSIRFHEQPEPGPARDPAQRGEGGVALEALAGAAPVHGLEVVEAPDAVEASVVGELRARRQLAPRHPLLGNVEPDPLAVGAMGFGLKLAVVAGGSPLTARLTDEL